MFKAVICILLFVNASANAALTRFTNHSRANCAGFNESISWDGWRSHTLYVSSLHMRHLKGILDAHTIDTGGIMKTHRAAAYHASEAYTKNEWQVLGVHDFYPNDKKRINPIKTITQARDCNLSSGWFFQEEQSFKPEKVKMRESENMTFHDEKEAQAWIKEHMFGGLEPGTVNVLSLKESEAIEKKQGRTLTAKDIKIIKNANRQLKKLGYDARESEDASLLINIEKVAAEHDKKYGGNTSQSSTHLRRSISELQMAYNFIGIPPHSDLQPIAFSPAGTWIEDKGWDSAAEFFVASDIGNCSLDETSLKLKTTIVSWPKDEVSYDVHNKTTIIAVTGLPDKGFVYDVQWADKELLRKLQCYNKDFNTEIKNKVIELAKRIDSQ